MSFDSRHDRHGAHGAAAAPHAAGTAAAATPGKRTQVELQYPAGSHAAHGAAADRAAGTPAVTARVATAAGGGDTGGVSRATLRSFLIEHENNRRVVYPDTAGNLTAGIGHKMTAKDHYQNGDHVSDPQIEAWFDADVAAAVSGAKAGLGNRYGGLNEARKIVVIDMAFNLGAAGFAGFHQAIAAMKRHDYKEAAKQMLDSAWPAQVHGRATQDAAIMRTGQLSGGGGGGDGDGRDAGSSTKAPSIDQVAAGHGVLKLGEQGPAVATIQRDLHISADGVFGEGTQTAVERFQRAHHLKADGVVGKQTLEALRAQVLFSHFRAQPAGGSAESAVTDGAPATGGAPAIGGEAHAQVAAAGRGAVTGGLEAPAGGAKPGATKPAHPHAGDKARGDKHGAWSPAPALADVKHGKAILHEGEQGSAVTHLQHLLKVVADGKFGPGTRAAVLAFQHMHHMKRHDGEVDAHTLELITKHPPGTIAGESHDGAAQRQKLLGIARGAAQGKHPDTMCYSHVCHYIIDCGGYGKIKDPYHDLVGFLAEAHNFADAMNARGPKHYGLEKLAISSPYNAPAGSIVVVAAGSPGTANPTAGDITVADGQGKFYNGGEMSYGGRAGWDAAPRAKLLGCYVPL